MKTHHIILVLLFPISMSISQSLYFPPINNDTWETTSPEDLGWQTDKIPELLNFLEAKNSKAFIVLKDGKIAIEKYFGAFTADSAWYWASAGKSLTAFMVGIAQQEYSLSISDSSSKYLGSGWTSCTSLQENAITIRHQLTMTTGMDDQTPDPTCTNKECLECIADTGSRWAYQNAPYTMLDSVISAATGLQLNSFINQRLKLRIGMTGTFIKVNYDNVFYSKARSMARFGLLILNKGNWGGTEIMTDTAYFRQMTTSSQTLNPSYGYLWWLNGKSSFKAPGLQVSFPGPLNPNAPSDMFAALGKDGQVINVVPSLNLVFVRMGNAPDEGFAVPFVFNDSIWQKLNEVMCSTTSSMKKLYRSQKSNIDITPSIHSVSIRFPNQTFSIRIFDYAGKLVIKQTNCFNMAIINTDILRSGFYYVEVHILNRIERNKLIICH